MSSGPAHPRDAWLLAAWLLVMCFAAMDAIEDDYAPETAQERSE
jgi:hypothetical protein